MGTFIDFSSPFNEQSVEASLGVGQGASEGGADGQKPSSGGGKVADSSAGVVVDVSRGVDAILGSAGVVGSGSKVGQRSSSTSSGGDVITGSSVTTGQGDSSVPEGEGQASPGGEQQQGAVVAKEQDSKGSDVFVDKEAGEKGREGGGKKDSGG